MAIFGEYTPCPGGLRDAIWVKCETIRLTVHDPGGVSSSLLLTRTRDIPLTLLGEVDITAMPDATFCIVQPGCCHLQCCDSEACPPGTEPVIYVAAKPRGFCNLDETLPGCGLDGGGSYQDGSLDEDGNIIVLSPSYVHGVQIFWDRLTRQLTAQWNIGYYGVVDEEPRYAGVFAGQGGVVECSDWALEASDDVTSMIVTSSPAP